MMRSKTISASNAISNKAVYMKENLHCKSNYLHVLFLILNGSVSLDI